MRFGLFFLLVACDPDPLLPGGSSGSRSTEASAPSQAAQGCRAEPAASDRVRFGVVSLPYGPTGGHANAWEVLALAPDGALERTGERFEMGRAFDGAVAFTPDGSLGLAPQDDGTLGVFTVDEEGQVEVVDPAFSDNGAGGSFYASSVWVDPSGERAIVVDGNWPNNGGGLYALALDCQTGAPTPEGLIVPTKLARHLFRAPGGRHVLVATEVGEGHEGHAHLLDLSGPTVLSSTTLWPDGDAIAGGASWAGDGSYLLVGDVSSFSGLPNRVAVARLQDEELRAVQVISPLEDPAGIGAWGQATLVASGFGDRLISLQYQGGATPFVEAGPISTQGGNPQIPTAVVTVRGTGAAGLMLVPEVTGVRVVRASADGELTDQGVAAFGSGFENMPGALGMP
ncbi:MAG: hypothetical protein EA397_04290 [Deltaproteobacteria bacterium]|nr:MAG: hypothetical protein EA397_04290 [Deltaproteobacteria bacterium]